MIVAAGCAAAIAIASRRIKAEQAAFRAPAAARCVPSAFNRSATLPGTSLNVAPLPDSYDASYRTQISLLGVPAQSLGKLSVKGSRSGSHKGRLRPYSQGDGASFVLSKPLSQGETVTVRGSIEAGTHRQRFAYHFDTATQDVLRYSKPSKPSGRDPNEKQHFHSEPALEPPSIEITASSPQASPGDIFTAPYTGPGPPGTMIFDEAGKLVWFHPLPANASAATNLQVQQLGGQPVLTWWQGYIPPQGFGQGEEIIANSAYQQIGRVRAGNGYSADLHDFKITPQGTGLLTVFNPIDCNLSVVGGPSGAAVTDSVFQEIDLRTGLVRREWHSLDHVPLGDSYSLATHSSKEWPFDYFHINSIDPRADGTTLISARNTWAMYALSTANGTIGSEIGGHHSSVKLASGTRIRPTSTTRRRSQTARSACSTTAPCRKFTRSRAGSCSRSTRRRTRRASRRSSSIVPSLSSGSQGNIQQLANGDMFVGWGSEPYFSEYSASGQLLFDAHMHGSYESYRTYRFPWTGTPASLPAIAAAKASGGRVTVYASWNGDTRTASWRVLAGASAQTLAPVATGARGGFETAVTTPAGAPYVAVQALDASGALLATSPTIRG